MVFFDIQADIILWDLNDVLLTRSRSVAPFLDTESTMSKYIISQFRFQKTVMPGMYKIVQRLDELGYEQHIASNISPYAFSILTDSEKSPHLKGLFVFMRLDKSVTYMFKNGKLLQKPAKEYFQEYLQKNKLDLSFDSIVFIDDKIINVRGAESVGIRGIHFKNPRQLCEELKKIGIYIS